MQPLKIIMMNKFLEPVLPLLEDKFTIVKSWEIDIAQTDLTDVVGMVTSVWDVVNIDLINRLPNLKIVSHMAAGIDTIDFSLLKSRNIILTNTPDVVTGDTADLAFLLMLGVLRNIVYNDKYVRDGHWKRAASPLNISLNNKTVGIVGLGKIGREIAKRSVAFNTKICYWGRHKQSDVPYQYVADLSELAAMSDVLVISCAGVKETKHLIDATILKQLGKNGYLVNISRGFVVNEPDLIEALKNGTIAGAGLDVFDNEPNISEEFFKLDNVILQPHVGSGTHECRANMYQLAADNIIQYFETGVAKTPM